MGGCSLVSPSSGLESAAIFMNTAVNLRAEDSGLPGCYAKATDKKLPTFRRVSRTRGDSSWSAWPWFWRHFLPL